MKRLTVDLLIDDPTHDEYVICLVENGPWSPIEKRLREIQERLYDSFDLIADGHLAARFPKSNNRKIRIQVDSYDSPPREFFEFLEKFAKHLTNDPEMIRSISDSQFVQSVRLTDGSENGQRS